LISESQTVAQLPAKVVMNVGCSFATVAVTTVW
jgi:hypothetical protein